MKLVSFFLICVVQFGCSLNSINPSKLEQKIQDMNREIEDLRSKIELIESNNDTNQLLERKEKVAFLEVGTIGFTPLKTAYGTITVKIKDIKPFASGSKVTLVLGNTLNAYFNEINFRLDYGGLKEDGRINFDTEKSKNIKTLVEMSPGKWTKIEVVLEGLPVSELGYLRLSDIELPSMRLM